MKKILLASAVIAVALTGCSKGVHKVFEGGSGGSINENGYQLPVTGIESINIADLELSDDFITYTIDISTPEGQTKLNGINEKQAKELALTEASIVNRCSLIVNPKYTFLKDGKKILRVTVSGQPAYYKNARLKPQAQYQEAEEEVEVVETTTTTTTTTKKPVKPKAKSKRKK